MQGVSEKWLGIRRTYNNFKVRGTGEGETPFSVECRGTHKLEITRFTRSVSKFPLVQICSWMSQVFYLC